MKNNLQILKRIVQDRPMLKLGTAGFTIQARAQIWADKILKQVEDFEAELREKIKYHRFASDEKEPYYLLVKEILGE